MRVSRVVLASFAVVFTLGAQNPASAQEDCLPSLKQDTISLDRASIVKLSLLDKRLQQFEQDKKTSVLATYGDYALDFDQSKLIKDKLETLLDIDYSESEKELLRSTTLPRNAVDAYLACLNSKNGIEIPAAISAGAVNSDSFFLTFFWNKRDRPEKEFATAKLMISQGVFKDSNSFNLEVPVSDREGITVPVVRNRFEPSEISIEIPGSDPTVITVPKVPSLRLVEEPIQGERFDYAASQSVGDFGRHICVIAPAGSILVPGSFLVIYETKAASGVTYREETATTQDPSTACQFVGGKWSGPFDTWATLNAQAVARILKPEPVPQAFHDAAQPAAAPSRAAMDKTGN